MNVRKAAIRMYNNRFNHVIEYDIDIDPDLKVKMEEWVNQLPIPETSDSLEHEKCWRAFFQRLDTILRKREAK